MLTFEVHEEKGHDHMFLDTLLFDGLEIFVEAILWEQKEHKNGLMVKGVDKFCASLDQYI
jgi:hypothetical protein